MNIDFTYRSSSGWKKVAITVCLVMMSVYVLLIIYPLFNMVISSFKTTREILKEPFGLPASFSFKNYKLLWVDKHFDRYFLNSLFVTAVAMIFVLLLGSMASFGVSRYHFKGSTLIYMLFLSGIMLPLKAAIIPLFLIIKKFRLVDSFASVILIFIAMGIPSTVFILSGFMKGT